MLVGRVEVAADLGDGLATNPDIPLAAVRQRRVTDEHTPSRPGAPPVSRIALTDTSRPSPAPSSAAMTVTDVGPLSVGDATDALWVERDISARICEPARRDRLVVRTTTMPPITATDWRTRWGEPRDFPVGLNRVAPRTERGVRFPGPGGDAAVLECAMHSGNSPLVAVINSSSRVLDRDGEGERDSRPGVGDGATADGPLDDSVPPVASGPARPVIAVAVRVTAAKRDLSVRSPDSQRWLAVFGDRFGYLAGPLASVSGSVARPRSRRISERYGPVGLKRPPDQR